jgi:glycosyltransferase involved in cell wall biosynthesis
MSKIAIVHDYLHQYGGAEKCLESWLKEYPEADIYTSIFTPENFETSKEITEAYKDGRIKTTKLQFFQPFLKRFFKHFFWLYPIFMWFMWIKDCDLVFVSSTFCGKYVKFKNCQKIIFYCHTPTRFLHNLTTETDYKSLNPVLQFLIPFFKFPLKYLDLRAIEYLKDNNVQFVANSNYIKTTIKDIYKTDSVVIFPPTDLQKFFEVQRKPENIQDFYFYFGRISFHKRIDILVKACQKLDKRLIVAGGSPLKQEIENLKKTAGNNPKIQFLGRISDDEIKNYLSKCKAFLFAGKEDFGIAPVEALASGTPIIMYQAGGALEFVKPGVNGLFFADQNENSLAEAILEFEKKNDWNNEQIRETSKEFSEETFLAKFKELASQ